MSLLLTQIAEMVGGQASVGGDVMIAGAATLLDAGPRDITFVEDERMADKLPSCRPAAAIVPHGFSHGDIPHVSVDSPRAAFARVVAHFRPSHSRQHVGSSPDAVVDSTAEIGDDVAIHPGASIGEKVKIGDGCIIHPGARIMAGCRLGSCVTVFPNAVLYENTVVGHRAIIHAGAIIGAFGFGYELVEGRHQLCHQLGYVAIGDDVEIGAGTTIDRGTFGPTIIGEGTKIDNLVMIGHNCRIGRHNLLVSQVGIAGSCTTGDYVVMAGQVGVRDHVEIGDGAMVGAKSGIGTDLPGSQKYLGTPAIPARRQMQIIFAEQKLPEMRRQLRQLEKQVEELLALHDQKRASEAA